MIKKATWICGLSLLLAGSALAQYTNVVYSEASDGVIEQRVDPGFGGPKVNDGESGNAVVWAGDWYSSVSSTGLASVVFPFLLPNAGNVSNPFTSAELQLYLGENSLNQVGSTSVIDLYYVRTSATTNALEATDYYSGSVEGNGTRIVPSFITPFAGSSNYVTTTAASLLTELNAAYDGGTGAGSYVFLRLSYGVDGWASPGDLCQVSTRNSSFQNDWPTLTLTDNVDVDADGLPDSWEIFYFGEVAIGSGLYVGTSDPDLDGLDSSSELAEGTNPNVMDTDEDGLLDGEEVNTYSTDPLDSDSDDDYLSDGLEITNTPFASNPNDVDSDDDNVNDATEFYCGSNPTNALSVPANDLPEMIGADFFDYANNPTNSSIFQLKGGEFFDTDNNTSNDLYVGHTCDISDWYDTGFNAGDLVNQGMVTSSDRLGLRSFNGLNTGGQDVGVFSTDPATGSTSSNVYFSVKMTTDGVVSYAGLSFYNGGSEQLFFGKTGGNGFWGVDGVDIGGVPVTETFGPTNNVEYTVVGKIDILGGGVTLWVDPVIASGEGVATVAATASLTAGGTYNALRLASGGSGSVRWDDLVLAYTWDGLDFAGTDSDSDLLRDTWELIWTNDLAVLFSGNDADSDGLNDEAELGLFTDPTNTDSDGDGLLDGNEVSGLSGYVTDPAVADTDGDGLSDGFEVTTSGSTNIYITDPLDADSDDDLYPDGIEVAAGTDPNDPNSNPGSVLVDGSKDALYGDPVAVQTIETQFGDNQSELNAAYAFSTNGTLCLMLTGNLEGNGNTLEIFIDSTDGVATNVLDAVGGDSVDNMDGLTFDTGFEPDYHIWMKNDGGMLLWVADLVTSNTSSYADVFGGGSFEGSGITGTNAANATPIELAFDNSNTAGVAGGTGAADTTAASNVVTGIELCIALSDIGSPATGTIKVAAIINNGDHNYLANQTLGGLPAGQGNLGAVGGTGTIDYNDYAGDQFFTANVNADVAVGPFSITDIQLINGNTDVQLVFGGLTIGQDYKILDSVDLTAGFADVAGSQFTATNESSHAEVIPAGAELNRFFEAATAP